MGPERWFYFFEDDRPKTMIVASKNREYFVHLSSHLQLNGFE